MAVPVVLSPKFQFQPIIFPEEIWELSANDKESFAHAGVKMKLETGEGLMWINFVNVSEHPIPEDAINVTL